MSPVLPFKPFLDALRARGLPLGLPEYEAFARLLEVWEGTSLGELRAATVALLAKSQEQAELVARTFDERTAALAPPAPVAPPAPPLERSRPWWDSGWLPSLVGAALGVLILILMHLTPPPEVSQPTPTGPRPAEVASPPRTRVLHLKAPTEPRPELPPPPEIRPWAAVALGVGALTLVAMGLLYGVQRRRAMRGWAEEFWRGWRGRRGGLHHFDLKLPAPAPPFSRQTLDEIATLLCRRIAEVGGGDQLDVQRTLKQTVEAGLAPSPAFLPRRDGRPLLMVQDTHPSMAIWERHLDALIDGLKRRGVLIDRWYLHPDGELVSRSPAGRFHALAGVLDAHRDDPVWVLSTGAGVYTDPRAPSPWLRELRRARRGAWINPYRHREGWRPGLMEVSPFRVWPMTPGGLKGAADAVASPSARRRRLDPARLAPDQRVRQGDVYRLMRMVSLIPNAQVELAQALRQRYCPDAPEEVVVELLKAGADPVGRSLSFTEERLETLLGEFRRAMGAEEEAVRRWVLAILVGSEPTPPEAHPVAHLRWRLACAMQRLYLRDAAEKHQAMAELEALTETEIWEDVEAEVGRLAPPEGGQPIDRPTLPVTEPVDRWLRRRMGRLLSWVSRRRVPLPPRELRGQTGEGSPGWPTPDLRVWAGGVVIGAAALLIAWGGGALDPEIRPHVLAYELVVLSEEPLRLGGRLLEAGPEVPRAPALYQGEAPLVGLVATLDEEAPVATGPGQLARGRWYQLRAVMAGGAWAYSEPRWIPAAEDSGEELVLVEIRGGAFWMGSDESDPEADDWEKPRHKVAVSPFWMGQTEVTVAQYRACVEAGGCTKPVDKDSNRYCSWGYDDRDAHPINCVDWDQAAAFAKWVGGVLPTEAQWEYAARGPSSRRYPWGDTPEPNCDFAMMTDVNDSDCGEGHTGPVCSKKEKGNTPEGLCDMAGNLWEWTSDWYDKDSYANSPPTDPPDPPSGSYRVVRGGSWMNGARHLRAANRLRGTPGSWLGDVGFRVALSAPGG